jgi:ABC-type lipoprotein release transport system permease subunit
MESIIIELLFVFLLFIGIGAYVVGKYRHIALLRAMGIRSSFVMMIMLIVYTWMTFRRDYQ